jgi:hypothetical protein
MEKKKLFVSFSGGETSAFMTHWCVNNMSDEYDIVVVFANTGEEHENTLIFVEQFSKEFSIHVYWVEAVFEKKGIATSYKIVDFKTANRNGKPFLEYIKKHGIPNQTYKSCTNHLKLIPMKTFISNHIGWNDYETAVGIRFDEIDRVSEKRYENKLIYPLIEKIPFTKQHVNFWWSQQKFRLKLKGYEGNCKTCWKKSDYKLMTIAKENPNWFDNFKKWESDFENYVPVGQNKRTTPIRFFREQKSVDDIFEQSKYFHKKIRNENNNFDFQTSLLDDESCDIFSNCGE